MASRSVAAALGNPEILSLILKKLQPRHDILVAAGVSKLWRRTAHKTCSTLSLDKKANFKGWSLLQCIRHFSSLTSLEITDYPLSESTPLFLGGLGVAFPNLRKLSFHVGTDSPPIGPHHLKGFLDAVPFLEIFTYRSKGGLAHPKALCGLNQIKHLSLQLNANLPEAFYNLTTLQKLGITDLSSQLRISPSLAKLVNLTSLSVECGLSAVPPRFGIVPQLKELSLQVHYSGEGQSLPDFSDLPRLRSLQMHFYGAYAARDHGFQIQGESLRLPASLGHFGFSGFPVSALPEGWEDLPYLQILYLEDLYALQEIPASIGRLRSLKVLDIEGCPLLKQLPESISKLEALQYLRISYNLSLESIPKGLQSLRNLKWLKAEYCQQLSRLPWQLQKLSEGCAQLWIEYELLDSGVVFKEDWVDDVYEF